MARIESQAVAGAFFTPQHLVPLIASRIEARWNAPGIEHDGENARCSHKAVFLDPCAGEGSAVIEAAAALAGKYVRFFAAEMERSRYEKLERAARAAFSFSTTTIVHGDAFGVRFDAKTTGGERSGASLLWLNPPYDYDKVHGRLEQRFLSRFTNALSVGGVLVLLVPYYALKACANTLAQEFCELHCLRFPSDEFDVFKQVVLYATKREPLLEPSTALVEQVNAWATNPDTIPELTDGPALATIPLFESSEAGFDVWEHRPFDAMAVLRELRPWHTSSKTGALVPQEDIIPNVPVTDLLSRSYPVAVPPCPAHIAAGIAAGIFNGTLVEGGSGSLPPILIKGVFNKEFRTVDEKFNNHGEVTGLVQVQQPRLVTTVLDLSTSSYHTVVPDAEPSGAKVVADMNMADLLENYGDSIMHVMLRQCPALHDPANKDHQLPLPPLARKLFPGQEVAVQATIKLLGGLTCKNRHSKAAIILGEVGSGKSTVALTVAHTLNFKRTLIMCPPHLLDGWSDQVKAVLPWARVVVLRDVVDVESLAADRTDQSIIAILSRETAKLGHAWESVGSVCPSCGAATPDGDLAKKRARCEAQRLVARTALGKLAIEMAWAMAPAFHMSAEVRQLLPGRAAQKFMRILDQRKADPGAWDRLRPKLDAFVDRLAARVKSYDSPLFSAIMLALVADPQPQRIARVARAVWQTSLRDQAEYSEGSRLRFGVRMLLMLLPPKSTLQTQVATALRISDQEPRCYEKWGAWDRDLEKAVKGHLYVTAEFSVSQGSATYRTHLLGDQKALEACLAHLATKANIAWTKECGEPLFQASSSPRRLPLATFITRRHPKLFDSLILDEVQDYSGKSSAQSHAAMRLTNLGLPMMMLTGTVMNGYAESLFNNMWAASPQFREEFDRDDRQDFITRYGYRERLLEEVDKVTRVKVTYGTMSDRVELCEHFTGNAPGVLPLFVIKHLLALSVTMQKVGVTPCVEHAVPIEPSRELLSSYKRLECRLVSQIRADMPTEYAGKLWGQVSELHGYLDRCTNDTGNTPGGAYEIRYPESVGAGLVAVAEPMPSESVTPKEVWMLEKVRCELAEGRNVMVFGWHTNVLPRLARLIEETGVRCVVLHPDKVPTAKRQAWIDREVVGKGYRVMVVNPVAVQTGLNNLVHFATEIWMQNCGCSPTIRRQAVGRVDRIGQKLETRIFTPYYTGTVQEEMHKLLMHKVAVSMSTDGQDARSALLAAGIGESDFAGFSIGRQIYEMIAKRGAS